MRVSASNTAPWRTSPGAMSFSIRALSTVGPRWVTRIVMPSGPMAVTSCISSQMTGRRKPSLAL